MKCTVFRSPRAPGRAAAAIFRVPFTPMCETDSYLQSRAAAKAESVSVAVIHCWDSGQNANHFLPAVVCVHVNATLQYQKKGFICQ